VKACLAATAAARLAGRRCSRQGLVAEAQQALWQAVQSGDLAGRRCSRQGLVAEAQQALWQAVQSGDLAGRRCSRQGLVAEAQQALWQAVQSGDLRAAVGSPEQTAANFARLSACGQGACVRPARPTRCSFSRSVQVLKPLERVNRGTILGVMESTLDDDEGTVRLGHFFQGKRRRVRQQMHVNRTKKHASRSLVFSCQIQVAGSTIRDVENSGGKYLAAIEPRGIAHKAEQRHDRPVLKARREKFTLSLLFWFASRLR
jgi:hypothetical protein